MRRDARDCIAGGTLDRGALGELVSRMTLEQKCALLCGAGSFTTRAFAGLGIPSMRFSDGPNGVRRQAGEADHLGLNPSLPATCFPVASALACSWDRELAYEMGRAMGEEARRQGVHVLLGPGLNIKRNPLCGRNFEYLSEDPLLSGELGAALVEGIQGAGVAACPKHFAVNSQETRRMASDSVVDERTLRELYLSAFERVVREAHPRCLMTSYNKVNGTYAHEHELLVGSVLRGEWGYQGAVVSDWGGSNDIARSLAAGSNFEMPAAGGASVRELVRAVKTGWLDEAVLDERVREGLGLLLSVTGGPCGIEGLADGRAALAAARGDRPAASACARRPDGTSRLGEEALPAELVERHAALARRIAARSAVLLKNEGQLLPLAPGARVALVGDFAARPRFQGAGSSAVNAICPDSLLGVASADPSLEFVGYEQGFRRDGTEDGQLRERACELARAAGVVVVCLGTTEVQEGEGADRADMRLMDNQVRLLEAVAGANSHVVVVLSCGSAVEVPWVGHAQALVLMGLAGESSGAATFDVLVGREAPEGRLAQTWPRRLSDVPGAADYPAQGPQALYCEGPYVGYRYFQTTGVPVAFPFGFGLGYTSFSYEAARLEWDEGRDTPARIVVTLANVGERVGREVVQAYVEAPRREVFGPARVLAGWALTELAAGERGSVSIDLDERAFEHWCVEPGAWEVEGGTWRVCAAPHAGAAGLVCETRVAGTGAVTAAGLAVPEPYASGHVERADEGDFAVLLGRPVPVAPPAGAVSRETTLGELGHSRSLLGRLLAHVLGRRVARARAAGASDLNALFAYNMPLRAIAKMSAGAANMRMVDALVMELRGWWGVGLVRLAGESVVNLAQNWLLERRLVRADREQAAGGRDDLRPCRPAALAAVRGWRKRHPGLWEFVAFNVLSNISTLTRFVLSWAGVALFVSTLGLTMPFGFLIFDYTGPGSGGLGAFLAFLVAEVGAQAVNYAVQRHLVFRGAAAHSGLRYLALAVLIVGVNLVLPGKVSGACVALGLSSEVASVVAGAANTLLAVCVSYPALKYWIMPASPDGAVRGGADDERKGGA